MAHTDVCKYWIIRRIYISLSLLLFLAACTGNALPAQVAFIPSSVQPQAIYAPIQPQIIVNGSLTENYTWAGIYASYSEQLTGLYSSFYIARGKPFIGQVEIGNMLDTAHQYAIMCLVDYQQLPCNPQLPLVRIESTAAHSTTKIALQLPMRAAGMHDLEIVIVSDPYRQVSQAELHTLTDVMNMPTMANLYVGDVTTAPSIHTLKPPTKPSLPNIGNPEFMANQLAGFVATKGIPVWLQAEAHAGKPFDFYLHFHNQQGWQRTNAMMTFINYSQAPIYVDGAAQLPLYVERHPGTWQSLHVTMQAPTKPGDYDLLLVNRTHAHERLEGMFSQMMFLFDQPFTQVQLVKLKVLP